MPKKNKPKETKILLPKHTQEEMLKFFLRTSIPKIVEAKKHGSEHTLKF